MSSITSRMRSLLVLNGEIPDMEVLAPFLRQGLPIIAADGAAWSLKKLQLRPDIIIGDLDSLKTVPDYKSSFPDSEIIEEPDQNSNDFQKALLMIAERDFAPVVVVGMQGGDLEHSFNNWSVAIKLNQKMEIWLMDQKRIGIGICAGGMIEASCQVEKTVSLIPQPDAVVTTSGLYWPLKEERLALGFREGARNEVIDKAFSVKVSSGSLMVFFGLDTNISRLEIPIR